MAFRDIISHDKEINFLKNALINDKIPNSYIFSGIEGIGKRLTALTFAKAINCVNEEYDSCDKCISCIKIDKGIHPDVKIIEPDGDYIKIEQIRNIKKEIYFKPFEGKKKVYIIDSSEKMNLFASNSLLKILEEPPSETILILITTRINAMLPTIISRCQKILFSPVKRDNIKKILMDRLNMDNDLSLLMSGVAQGSLNRALTFNEDIFIDYKRIMTIMEDGSLNRIKDIFDFIHNISLKPRDRINRILYLLRLWIRDIIIYKEVLKEDHLINFDIVEDIKKFSKMDINSLFNMLYIINDTERDIGKNANIELAIDGMMIKLISIKEWSKRV